MKTKLLIASMFLAGATAQATLLYQFDFSGTGALTDDANWGAFSGADGSITNNGSAHIGGGAEDVGAQNVHAAQTGNVFIGFDLTVNSANSGDEYSFGFLRTTSDMMIRWGLDGETGNQYSIDLYSGTSVDGSYGTFFDEGTTYRIVIGFDGTDTHRLWVDPTTGDEGSPVFTHTLAEADDPTGFFIRQAGGWDNGASDWELDDLRIANDFANAVGSAVIPEPSTFALFGTALLGLMGLRRKLA